MTKFTNPNNVAALVRWIDWTLIMIMTVPLGITWGVFELFYLASTGALR